MTITRPERTCPSGSFARQPSIRVRPLALLLAAVLVVAGCTTQDQGPDLPPQRILQSVDVQMAPDGAMTAIKSTALSVRENASDATTDTRNYSPREVADDLPVRVSTAYRTADRTGTNLDELAGHTGRIEIDITVQNLTLRPENLTYDVAGSSRTQPALVGAPLTVVASTALSGVEPTEVITATASGTGAATNGVLSRSDNGEAVIQWAALLASPQMGSNATLRLVADAKDFKVPTFDLSVQPGLVTDPSVSRVLESAFNTSPTSQLALEQRTIRVITDVNQVLTRASGDISKVRKNLESTSKTLGTRTVKELEESTKGLSSSVKTLDGQLTDLNRDIEGTVEGAQSAVLQELSQTVGALDKLLGDTSGDPPAPRVSGNGCATVVGSPQAVGSVYGNLLQVSGQLQGYATASKNCKAEAQAVLLRSVGPAEPSAELCKEDKSTTCSLWAAEQTFAAIMQRLVDDGEKLISKLQPEIVATARDEYAGLEDEVVAVGDNANLVKKSAEILEAAAKQRLDDVEKNLEAELAGTKAQLEAMDQQLEDLSAVLTQTDEGLDLFGDGLETIHVDAGNAIEELRSEDEDNPDRGDSVEAQILAAAELACEMGEDGAFDEGADERDVEKMRAYLVGTGCELIDDDNNPQTPPVPEILDAPSPFRQKGSLLQRIKDQSAAWQKVVDATDEESDESLYGPLRATKQKLADSQERITAIRAAIQKLLAQTPEDVDIDKELPELDDLTEQVEELTGSIEEFQGSYQDMGPAMEALIKYEAELPGLIRAGFKNASQDATKRLAEAIEPAIRKISKQAEIDSEAVGKMFEQSAVGLSNGAAAINKNGARIIDSQRRALRESEKRTAAAAAKQVDESLGDLARGVSDSTRDVNASFALLETSLKKVLLDLGDRKVNGSGLLGSMATSAAQVGTADFQLALASGQTEAYANVRGEDINGILLKQAQLQAALQVGATLPAFQLEVPPGAESQTVYTFRIGAQ
ncbi:hypothetical protein [Microlunatus speluncae]|uniref:hypothetical protein n=1 Tax=Microlunatus speluncae TaxID=2594267 RepID=UPI001266146A|nr:hypothetical protein [Microlunatus speluncae]